MAMRRVVPILLWNAAAIADAGTLVSGVLDCRYGEPETMRFQVTSATGTADVKLEWAGSDDGVTFNAVTCEDPIVASTNTTYTSKNPEDAHYLVIPWAPFLQFTVTDLASTGDSKVSGTLWLREHA